jgi:hypothetical protein
MMEPRYGAAQPPQFQQRFDRGPGPRDHFDGPHPQGQGPRPQGPPPQFAMRDERGGRSEHRHFEHHEFRDQMGRGPQMDQRGPRDARGPGGQEFRPPMPPGPSGPRFHEGGPRPQQDRGPEFQQRERHEYRHDFRESGPGRDGRPPGPPPTFVQ